MLDPFPVFNRDHSSVLPRLGKAMIAENHVEDMERKEPARLGRCLSALFGIQLRPGTLLTLKPLMVA